MSIDEKADLIERLDQRSHDLVAEKIDLLRTDFPEVFQEGRVDFDALRRVLGDWIAPQNERFGLAWPGKAEAIRAAQQPSFGTLRPDREDSVEFDTTQNVIIEGDNLEVLKLLQRSYHSQVKMIYIDPPYNTGNDFIYPDNFRDPIRNYLELTGQIDSDGVRTSTNPETAGRYHSNWLNMMYPRLMLARNLLREDGVIFVSIDDNEVHNLRTIMNEIFGEENFIATVVWQKVYSPKNTARHFSEDHDYIVLYARNGAKWLPTLLPRTDEANARYDNPDNDPRGPWKPSDLTARNYYSKGQYEVISESGRVFRAGIGRYWRQSYEKFLEMDRNGEIWWGSDGNSMPAQKRFLSQVRKGIVPQTLWDYKSVGHTQEAKKELISLVPFADTENVLNSVKPSRLIRKMLLIATDPVSDDLVFDFFAGSGVTGQAVIDQNAEDGGNRKFVCVQLPEPLPKPEASLTSIFDIALARLRNAHSRLANRLDDKARKTEQWHVDSGFRTYRLDTSNLASWSNGNPSEVQLEQALLEFADNITPGRTSEDILAEVLLKNSFSLTAPVERLTLADTEVFAVEGDKLLLCLAQPLSVAAVEAMADRVAPEGTICVLDAGFANNDQLKVNAVETIRARERDQTITFRVL
jgi:adenine-specific DNA-methyltransferase